MPRQVLAVLALTLALGATVAASWLVFGGAAAFGAPDRVLAREWPRIYCAQAVLAAFVGGVLALDERRWPRLLGCVAAAWGCELVVLTLGGNLLANELDPDVAWRYWWMGTGGPIQPLAAVVGVLAWRRVSSRA